MEDWADWGEAGSEGPHPAQNPPEVSEHDEFVLAWFSENVNSFVKDFGLMSMLISELKLNAEERILFLRKIDLIYRFFLMKEEKRLREKYAKSRD